MSVRSERIIMGGTPGLQPRPRPLNEPAPLRDVETDQADDPTALVLGGRSSPVVEVLECWKIDEGWWRTDPVSRRYYRVVLDDGRILTIFVDLRSGSWWTQRP